MKKTVAVSDSVFKTVQQIAMGRYKPNAVAARKLGRTFPNPVEGQQKIIDVVGAAGRALRLVAEDVTSAIDQQKKAHSLLHAKGTVDPKDCERNGILLSSLRKKFEVLLDLSWFFIRDQSDETIAASNLILNKDWRLGTKVEDASASTSTQTEIPGLAKEPFGAKIKQVLTAKKVVPQTKDTNKVNGAAGEKVLGVITDPALQALLLWSDEIGDKIFVALGSPKGPADLGRVMSEKTLEEMEAMTNAAFQLRELSKTLRDLFWIGVRESIPAAALESNIGMREGWQVVSMPPQPGYGNPFELLAELRAVIDMIPD